MVQDSDFEYDPHELPKLLVPILDGRADVVFGARASFVGSECHRVMYYWHSVVNRFLTTFCNMLTDLTLHDMECCYKMFKRELLEKITLRENRFGFDPEITIKLARQRCRFYEVTVSYSGRTYQEGKKINWKDGVSALRCIVKYALFRMNLSVQWNNLLQNLLHGDIAVKGQKSSILACERLCCLPFSSRTVL